MDQRKLTPFAWLFGGKNRMASHTISKRRLRRESLGCETLEGRVVLSHGGFGGFGGPPPMIGGAGGNLSSDLSTLGVLASYGGGFDSRGDWGGASSSSTTATQLTTDLTKLKTDLQALATKSGVTVADLNNLRADDLAIIQSGFRPDSAKLQAAITELATAIAAGADTTQAKADFTAVFSGSSVSQTIIDKAFTDLTQTITDSKVTTADLQTIATDRAAIQTDLDSLQASGGFGEHGKLGGGTLLGSLASLGIVADFGDGFGGHGPGPGGHRGPRGGLATTTNSQLSTDLQKLQTDLKALAAKSGVTVADLTSLKADAVAISQSGFSVDATKLQAAVSELATAVLSSADTTQAKADFTAVFSGSTLSQDVIDKAFADLTQVITDSWATAADLQTIAADRSAIQADLSALRTTSTTSSSSTSSSASTTTTTTTTGKTVPTAAVVRQARFRARAARRGHR